MKPTQTQTAKAVQSVNYDKIVIETEVRIKNYATGVKGETTHNKRAAEREMRNLNFISNKIFARGETEELKSIFLKIKEKIDKILSPAGEAERRESWKNMPCYKNKKLASEEKKIANLAKKYL